MALLSYIFLFIFVLIGSTNGSTATDIHIKLAQAALEQVGVTTIYSFGYTRLKYPGGDLPKDRGVCSDVIVRAFRAINIDLQKEVHEDMSRNFDKYPKFWKMKRTDANIDHRRVPNLMKYFQRQGKSIGLNNEYKPGDVVAWQLKYGLFHIGVVSNEIVPNEKRYYIVHNIGGGAQKEDVLYKFKIIGHYRW